MGEDEAATLQTLKGHREAMSSLIEKHQGRLVETRWGNLLAEFASVVDALECAVEIQKELKGRNEDDWYPIQVKQKDKASRPDIDSFEAAMTREDRKKGFFVAFDYSSDALREVDGFFRRSGKIIIPLTVKEIIEETLAKKLA